MTELQKTLTALSDPAYAAFQAKLVPTVGKERILGVRVPVLRRFAKEYAKKPESREFLHTLPHMTYDEDMLHALLVSGCGEFDRCVFLLDEFLPHVDNWAVCDALRPKVLGKDKKRLLAQIRRWISSEHDYTCRFGIEMLMCEFLDEAFCPGQHALVCGVTHEEYYVRMMMAWYFATALAKQWDATIPVIENHTLSAFVHRMTIRKACESFRITREQKQYLVTLKEKGAGAVRATNR